MAQLHHLFAKVVYTELPPADLDFSKELDYILSLPQVYAGNSGFSEDVNVLEDPNLKSIKDYVWKHIDIYTKEIMCYDAEFFMNMSWAIINKTNIATINHYHPNSFISGCIYLQNDDLVPMYLHGTATPLIDPYKTKMNMENSGTWPVPTHPGIINIWPSEVRHSSGINTSINLRVAISFNIFPKSIMGSTRSLDYLDLTKLG
jgi:hypothetical protein